jgi:hypothetical protein
VKKSDIFVCDKCGRSYEGVQVNLCLECLREQEEERKNEKMIQMRFEELNSYFVIEKG